MILNRDKYFKEHGFKEEPFATTNALQEDFLEEYFITPPYFYSLIGSTTKPKSTFVIAPRGTGKTAQRIMIEKMSEHEDGLLTVVYDRFPIEGVAKVEDIKLEDHLIRINKYLIIALLTELNERGIERSLTSYERANLKLLIELYLKGISNNEIDNAIKSIKGVTGRIGDLWRVAGKPINSVVNSILKAKGIEGVDLSISGKSINKIDYEEIESHLSFLEEIFKEIGIKSVYVLVDSIDETSLTGNDAKKSYLLIKPFIKDLRILERRTIVFKFFVWDKIEEYWTQDMRKDRIETFVIEWNLDEIKNLIRERLKAYSEQKIDNLSKILNCDEKYIDLIYIFANNSPRDLINILKLIFDNHLRKSNNMNELPNKEAIINGIEDFCKNKFEEIITTDKQRKDLKRVKIATFTIPYLYNEIFKCESSTARNILMPWTRADIVYSSTNKIKVKKSQNPINIYTFSDIRIARHVCSNQRLEEFIDRNLITCEECGVINVFDKENSYGIDRWQCKECLSNLIIK